VVLASVVGASDGVPAGTPWGEPDGAIRVDLVRGEPLVLPVVDGGGFHDRMVREIRAFDQDLHLAATHDVGLVGPAPWMHGGVDQAAARGPVGPDDVRLLLHEAELIALRELRQVLTIDRSASGRSGR
jgi:hypothetical protein